MSADVAHAENYAAEMRLHIRLHMRQQQERRWLRSDVVPSTISEQVIAALEGLSRTQRRVVTHV